MVVRPLLHYGSETAPLIERQEADLEMAEVKILRSSLREERIGRIKDENIRGAARILGIKRGRIEKD